MIAAFKENRRELKHNLKKFSMQNLLVQLNLLKKSSFTPGIAALQQRWWNRQESLKEIVTQGFLFQLNLTFSMY